MIASLRLACPGAMAEDAMPKATSDGVVAAVADTAITAKVKTTLMSVDSLNKSDISVTTTNGVVTLEGTASSADAKVIAGTDTLKVEGVKSVDNNLKVAASSAVEAKTRDAVAKTGRVVSDSWITTKVKSEILADSMSKGFKVSVKTLHGVVVLSGSLASQDAIEHVKDIVAKVKGVKSVEVSAITIASK
ncbi:MAG: BON domain-containing protein [Uliginosibacterium sp.]|nr:BON domain-containing protein [Uliginosibacterium sp.]